MKTILPTITIVVLSSTLLWGQTSNLPPGVVVVPSIRALPVPPLPTEDSHERVSQTNGAGLGLNAFRVPERAILPVPGGARADFGLLKVFFPLDASEGSPLTITTADGRTLACRATFLAVRDLASDQSVLLAEVTNRIGLIVGEREVIYTNCFDSLRADLRFRISENGYSLEQDVVFQESPVIPGEFSQNCQLEIWTAWDDAEPVSTTTQTIDLRASDPSGLLTPSLMEDTSVNFGSARIVNGHAFSSTAPDEQTPVAKTWVRISSQDWLVESVDYLAVKSKLDLLPNSRRGANNARPQSKRAELIRSLAGGARPPRAPFAAPRGRSAGLSGETMRLARATPAKNPQFVMDFIIVSSVSVPSGIISWWPAGNPNDAIGTNHVTLANGAGFFAGKVGPGFTLDGSNDRITALDSATLDFGAGADFSIEAWIKPQTNTTDYGVATIVSKRYSPDLYTTLGYELYLSDGKLALRLDDPGNKYYFPTAASSPNLRDGTFHHVAVTVDRDSSTGLRFYVDGQLLANDVFNPTVCPGDLSNTEPLRLGNHPTPSLNCFFKGIIDEPAIYNRALGAAEIQAIYNAGAAGKHNPNCVTAPTDIVAWWPGDGNGYDLARTNFATVNGATYESAVVAQGFSFDGVNDGVTAASAHILNLGANDDVTIETWIKPLTNATTYGVMSIAGKRYSPNASTATGYELILINGAPGFQIANASGVATFSATGDLRDGGYHHLVVTLDRDSATGGKIYVDGTAILTFNPTVLSGSLSNAEPFRIGVHPQSGFNGWYKGVIDEVSVYRRALNSVEVTALYAAGSAGKCKVDTDNDGLTDLQEQFLGTNPNDPDSDNDGLTDGDEVFVYHTNPNNADTDGDGVGDGIEVLQGRNPLVTGATVDAANLTRLNVFTPLK